MISSTRKQTFSDTALGWLANIIRNSVDYQSDFGKLNLVQFQRAENIGSAFQLECYFFPSPWISWPGIKVIKEFLNLLFGRITLKCVYPGTRDWIA